MIFQILRELVAVKNKTFLCLLVSFALALAAGTGCGHKAPPRPIDAPVKKKKELSGSSKSDNKDSKDTSDPFMGSSENKNNADIKDNNAKNGGSSKPIAPSKENP